MNSIELRTETYSPTAQTDNLAEVFDFFEAHSAKGLKTPPPRYLLAGASAGDQVELPEDVYLILRKVVTAMHNGLSVSIAPQTTMVTTQQAAELLGVSRPTLVKLLDAEKMPYEKMATHRKIRLADVLEYRERRRQEQYDALAATSVQIDDETDLEEILRSLKDARRAVAERHRSEPVSG